MIKTLYLVALIVICSVQIVFSQPNKSILTLHYCIEASLKKSIVYKNMEIGAQVIDYDYEMKISSTNLHLSLLLNTPYSISKNENEVFYSTIDKYKYVQSTDQFFNPFLSVSLSQYLPTDGNLSLDISAYNNRWYSALREDKDRLTGSAIIQYDQSLFRRNELYYLKQKAYLSKIQSEHDFINSKNEFICNVISGFYDILLLHTMIGLENDSFKENNLNHQLVREMYQTGRKSELDLLNSEIFLESQQLRMNKLSNDYKTIIDKFGLLTGIDNLHEFVFNENIQLHSFDVILEDLMSIALDKNLSILSIKMDLKNTNLTLVQLAEQQNLNVDLNSSLSFDNTRDFIPKESSNNFYSWKVGINFRFPVLDGGYNSYQIRSNTLNKERLENKLTYRKKELIQSIIELTDKLAALKKEIEIGERKQMAAEKAYKLAQIQFASGNLSLRDKIESEVLYKTSFIIKNESIINYNKTVCQLKKLIGLDLENEEF